MNRTMAEQARKTAPMEPFYYSPASVKTAYRQHFANAGGVPALVDTAGSWQSPRPRRCWVFPDGSRFISDWAGGAA